MITADNKQAIEMAQTYTLPINISETQTPEYDIHKVLHLLQQQIPVTIKYQWVKGHQDELSDGSKIHGPFSRTIQTNINMDYLAKRAATRSPTEQLIRPMFSTTVMGAYDSNNIFISDIYTHILNQTTYDNLYIYLKGKHQWTDDDMATIMWANIEKALNTYPSYQQTKYAQLMYHWQFIGEGKELLHSQDGQCPMKCGSIETKMHYLYCNDSEFKKIRECHI